MEDLKRSIVGGPGSTGTEISCRHWNALLNDINNISGEQINPLYDTTSDLTNLGDEKWIEDAGAWIEDAGHIQDAVEGLFQ